jgi:hypothetical protein
MVDEIVDVEGHRVPRRILDMYPLLPYALRALMADHNGEEPSVRCPVCDTLVQVQRIEIGRVAELWVSCKKGCTRYHEVQSRPA